MAGSSNAFIGLDIATLQSLQAEFLAAIRALAVSQSYSLNGRSLQRSDLAQVKATLGEINAAIADATGASANVTHVSFTGL